jgi:hypothetical protein
MGPPKPSIDLDRQTRQDRAREQHPVTDLAYGSP